MPPILLGLMEKRAGGPSKAQALVHDTGLATDRPPRNMVPIAPCLFTTSANIQAPADFGLQMKCEVPQGLKPNSPPARNGTASEAAEKFAYFHGSFSP